MPCWCLAGEAAQCVAHDDISEANGFAVAPNLCLRNDLERLRFLPFEHNGLRSFIDYFDRATERPRFGGWLVGRLKRYGAEQ